MHRSRSKIGRTKVVMNARSVLSFLAAAVLMSVATAQTYDLKWKPTVGQSLNYKLTTVMKMDMGAGLSEFVVSFVSTSKTTKIENGEVVQEGGMKDFSMMMDGQDMSSFGAPGGDTKSSITMKLDGTLLKIESDAPQPGQGLRLQRMTSFRYPQEEIAVGHEWTVDHKAIKEEDAPIAKSKFVFEGLEKKEGIDCYKIKLIFSEMEGDVPFGAMGTMWLNQKDRSLVAMEGEYQNVKFADMMPPTNAKFTMVLVK